MRWLRDNWIDALIFAVFAVTVVGIVLFLTGVNPFKASAPSGVTTPAHVAEPAPEPGPTGESAAGEVEGPVTVVPLLPEAPGEQPAAPSETAPQTPSAPRPAAGKTGTRPSAPAQASPASASKPQPAAPSGPEAGVFRVSVGAFGNPVNALALAQKLEAQGYAVRLEPVGRVTRVAVGPYHRKTAALEAARKLSDYEPQVYRGDSPEPTRTYLQVGAFKQLASAEATVQSLRGQGIGPVVLWYQKPWIKVWVGPVDPGQTALLKQKLAGAGFEVVEVR